MHGRLFNRLPKAKDNDSEEHGYNGVAYEVQGMPTNSEFSAYNTHNVKTDQHSPPAIRYNPLGNGKL